MSTPGFANNRDDYCYRHPDRQSFVLCQRCLRTVCPECQTQGAVGVICPECMAEQRKAQTPAQAKAQRRWRTSPVSGGRPVVTLTIVAITAAVFVLQLLVGNPINQALGFYAGALYPQLTGGSFEPWRVVTAALVHSSFWHIGLNMLALWMLGRTLEPLLGRWRFLALYLISAIGGSLTVAFLAPNTFVVGASGAIFGLFGAFIVIARHIGGDIRGILVVLGLNLVIGFIPGFNVSWQAHVGGLIAGAVIGLIYARTREPGQRALQTGLVSLWAVALCALFVVPALIYG